MDARAIALEAALEASRRRPLRDILAKALAASGLGRRDRALAEEIAFGSLRRRLALDLTLSRVVSRGPGRLDPALREALRQAAHQILFLDRVPGHAAVNETVSVVKARLGEGAAKLANAALRALVKLVKDKDAPPPAGVDARAALAARGGRFVILREAVLPDPADDLAGWLAGAYGYPRWMVERWLTRHGRGRAESILEWGNAPPPVSVRLNPARTGGWPLPDDEAARVFESCRGYSPGEAPGMYRIVPEGAPGELPGFARGLFTMQDETQARPVRVLAPPAGARVLDLCAGPGGKSVQLAEAVGPAGEVVSVEIDPARAAKVRATAARLGLDNVAVVEADALDPSGPPAGGFGHVLLDAPCSNLGALDRRPEVRHRVSEKVVTTLAAKETALLRSALRRLAPGGVAVYSVCSFEEEETGAAVRAAVERNPDLTIEAEHWTLPEPGARGGGYCVRIARGTVGSTRGAGPTAQETDAGR